MASLLYSMTSTHARVNWARGRSSRVPSQTAKEMAAIKSLGHAERFAQAAGIKVDKVVTSASAYAVWVSPPERLWALGKTTYEYHSPQIILPRIECGAIPYGTALLNILVPDMKDRSEVEAVFAEFQKVVQRFSKRIGASPLACITGYKSCGGEEKRTHDLYYRGFRFFYGPQPDALFEFVRETLDLWERVYLPENQNSYTENMKPIIQRRSCEVDGERIGHSLIYDIKLEDTETHLVDLR